MAMTPFPSREVEKYLPNGVYRRLVLSFDKIVPVEYGFWTRERDDTRKDTSFVCTGTQ